MIRQFIRKTVKTISEGASIIDAAEKMRQEGIGSLLVERKGKPVGILSDTDIVQKAVGAKKNLGGNHGRKLDDQSASYHSNLKYLP